MEHYRLGAALILTASLVSPAFAQDAAEGEGLFAAYCATCHGADASGSGPMAELIAIKTPDLTGLAARNGGVFPAAAVAGQIDGRDPLQAHGGDMPVFGRFFEGDAVVPLKVETGQPMMTSPPIADLLAWLETIQK